jgi:hypothetical protein
VSEILLLYLLFLNLDATLNTENSSPKWTGSVVSRGPKMQLWQDGVLQGLGVDAIPGSERPKNLDGTMVGDIGFDPLGFSNWLNLNWAREAEIKHGRIAMLAATGMIVQVYILCCC